jgi:hypothetical protein
VHGEYGDEPRTGCKQEATLPVDRTHGRTSVVYRVGGLCIRPPYRDSTGGHCHALHVIANRVDRCKLPVRNDLRAIGRKV